MSLIGIDGIGGDYTQDGPPGIRAIKAVSHISDPQLNFKIALDTEPPSKLPQNVEWFKAGSIDEAISTFCEEGIPAVTALNVQKGVSSLIGRKIRGIRRVPFAVEIPHIKQGAYLFLDVGVNSDLYDVADCAVPPSRQYERKARDMVNFARLGSLYMELYRKVRNPRVCLLTNGIEESKGNAFLRKCQEALAIESANGMLNYRGFAEPTDTEKLDVLVTDGLTGNIGLKFIEATIQFYKSRLGVFRNLMHFFRVGAETSRHTGAFVLGLGNNSVIVKVHGAAKAKDFATAYKKAADFSKPIAVKAYVYPGLSAAIEAEFYKRFAEQQKPFKHLNEA